MGRSNGRINIFWLDRWNWLSTLFKQIQKHCNKRSYDMQVSLFPKSIDIYIQTVQCHPNISSRLINWKTHLNAKANRRRNIGVADLHCRVQRKKKSLVNTTQRRKRKRHIHRFGGNLVKMRLKIHHNMEYRKVNKPLWQK